MLENESTKQRSKPLSEDPTGFLNRMRLTVERRSMFERETAVVVGVSGGADSVALLHGLKAMARELRITLAAAHLNHGLRGAESAQDARFAESIAVSLNVPFFVEEVDVRAVARRSKTSLEGAGRQARYEFLERVAGRFDARTIATGHTLDDQAETVLIRLLRGSGTEGLSGIYPVVRRPGCRAVVRPLIDTLREEVLDFMGDLGVEWRTDESNLEMRFVRNRVRHQLLPLLSSFNPRVKEALARSADIFREENHLLEVLAREAAGHALCANGTCLDGAALSVLPEALRRRVARHVLTNGGYPPRFDVVAEFLDRAERRGRARIPAPADSAARPEPVPGYQIDVRAPGEFAVPYSDWTLRLEAVERSSVEVLRGRGAVVHLTGALLGKPLAVRNRKEGDRFHPFGGPGGRRLKRYFNDRAVAGALRDSIPILTCQGKIAWVGGGHVDQEFAVRADDAWVLRAVVSGKAGSLPKYRGIEAE